MLEPNVITKTDAFDTESSARFRDGPFDKIDQPLIDHSQTDVHALQ